MKGKKLRRFQFHFPGLLGTFPNFFFYNWTSEIIPFIYLVIRWTGPINYFKKIQVLSICLPKGINGIIFDVQVQKKKVFCFDIREVPRSPGKWNWNQLYFLPFIFTFEQGDHLCQKSLPHMQYWQMQVFGFLRPFISVMVFRSCPI